METRESTNSSAVPSILKMQICSIVTDKLGNDLVITQISYLLWYTFVCKKCQVNEEKWHLANPSLVYKMQAHTHTLQHLSATSVYLTSHKYLYLGLQCPTQFPMTLLSPMHGQSQAMSLQCFLSGTSYLRSCFQAKYHVCCATCIIQLYNTCKFVLPFYQTPIFFMSY